MSDVSTRLLKFKINSTEYTAAAGTAKINAADSDSDFTSFADAAAGGAKDHTLQRDDRAGPGGRLAVADASTSPPGATCSFIGSIYGNTTASDTQPLHVGDAHDPGLRRRLLGWRRRQERPRRS
jgi:hypothetical protein